MVLEASRQSILNFRIGFLLSIWGRLPYPCLPTPFPTLRFPLLKIRFGGDFRAFSAFERGGHNIITRTSSKRANTSDFAS